jgi:hypothetical protein
VNQNLSAEKVMGGIEPEPLEGMLIPETAIRFTSNLLNLCDQLPQSTALAKNDSVSHLSSY